MTDGAGRGCSCGAGQRRAAPRAGAACGGRITGGARGAGGHAQLREIKHVEGGISPPHLVIGAVHAAGLQLRAGIGAELLRLVVLVELVPRLLVLDVHRAEVGDGELDLSADGLGGARGVAGGLGVAAVFERRS